MQTRKQKTRISQHSIDRSLEASLLIQGGLSVPGCVNLISEARLELHENE